MKKLSIIALSTILAGSIGAGSAFAFQDLDSDNKEAVTALHSRGIISGMDNEHFAPKSKLTYAQGIHLIVKAFGLNMDNLRFIKQPVATDIYTSIPNDAWYAEDFIISHYNGLEISREVNPASAMTREQFAFHLVTALEKKGDFPMLKILINVKDNDQITPDYQGAVQRLLAYKFAELDKNDSFNPKGELTRGQAAVWIHRAVTYLENHMEKPAPAEEATLKVEKVNDELNKITLSRGEKPNSGYDIVITSIQFTDSAHAVVTYKLTEPDPAKMYAQVVTEPKATTYVSSSYEVTAVRDTGSK